MTQRCLDLEADAVKLLWRTEKNCQQTRNFFHFRFDWKENLFWVFGFFSQRCQSKKIQHFDTVPHSCRHRSSFFFHHHVKALNFYEVKNWNSSNKNRIDICCPMPNPQNQEWDFVLREKSRNGLSFLVRSARPRTRFHTRFDTLLI